MVLVAIGLIAAGTGLLALVKHYMNGGKNIYFPQLKNKIIIVTGANTGIGYQTVLELAKLNAKTIVLACRSQERTYEAIQNLKKELPPNSQTQLEFIKLDLNDLKSVQQFALTFRNKYKSLDLLINNAGIMALPQRETTVQNFEKQLGTNHIGHFLLTKLVEDLLTDQSRIINVSSLAHEKGKIFFDDIQCERKYSAWGAYQQSKLANIYFTKQLQNLLREQGKQIKVVSLHPGVVRTELARYMFDSFGKKMMGVLIAPFTFLLMKSSWQGAQTTLHCALCDYSDLSEGSYYSDCKVKKETLPNNWQEEIKHFWKISDAWVKDFIPINK